MKRGFTLIELLAVVVLLGCVFALSFPKIMNVLEKKNEEIEDSKLEIIYNAGNRYIDNNINSFPKIVGNSYCFRVACLDSENLIPLDIEDYYDQNVQIKIGKSSNYIKLVEECEKINDLCNNTSIALRLKIGMISTTTNSATIPYKLTIPNSDIEEVTCKFGAKDTELNYDGEIVDNKCIIKDTNGIILSPANDYYFQIKAKDKNERIVESEIIKIKTKKFANTDITSTPNGWSISKNVTISGATVGAKLQYKIGEQSDWQNYSKPLTITSNTTIHSRLSDGTNNSEINSYTITTIDDVTPIITLNEIKKTTNRIEISFSEEDSQMGIQSTLCEYGESINYNRTGILEKEAEGTSLVQNKCVINELNNNKDYYYKLTVTDKAGLISVKTGKITTNDFTDINITATPSEYSTLKSVKIESDNSDFKIQYKTSLEEDWIDYLEEFSITDVTTVYARLLDGINESATATATFTKFGKKINVTFDANGIEVDPPSKSIFCIEQTIYDDLPEPTKDGYIFAGWFTDTNYTNEVKWDTIITNISDHTLYANIAPDFELISPKNKISIGEKIKLTADPKPVDISSIAVTYSTSDSAIATVDSSGNVIGVGLGTATITATSNDGVSKSVDISVMSELK